MMVAGAPLTRMVRPMAAGSAPNRSVHTPWPMMITGAAPSRSSSGRKSRPTIGCSRRTLNALAERKQPAR